MLSQAQQNQLTALAVKHADENVSFAASIYKTVEERDGFEAAQEASDFYCNVQKAILQSYADEAAALEEAYEEYAFERGQEM